MKDKRITTMNPRRRGFLAALAAVIGRGLLWRRPPPPPTKSGPRELSLQQVDYHRSHDLAG